LSIVSGYNNWPFTVTAAANTTQSERTATITIAANGVGDRTITVTQDADILTGMDDIDNIEFSLYPNPTNDFLFIKSDNAGIIMVSVIDLSGKTVLIDPDFSQDDYIDLSSIKNGIYFLSFQTANKVQIKKVVKN
jgi:hypothetical protein